MLTALADRISSPSLAGVGPKNMQKAFPVGQQPKSPFSNLPHSIKRIRIVYNYPFLHPSMFYCNIVKHIQLDIAINEFWGRNNSSL